MLYLSICCFCYNLRKGCIIIGALSLLGSLLLIILNIAFQEDLSQGLGLAVFITFIIASAILLIVSILLIIGAVKGYRWLLVPWLVYGILTMITAFVFWFHLLGREENFQPSSIVKGFASLITSIYYKLVVFSHFKELKLKEESGEFDKMNLISSSTPGITSNERMPPELTEKGVTV